MITLETIALIIASLGFVVWFTLVVALAIVKGRGLEPEKFHRSATFYSWIVFALASLTWFSYQ